MSVVCLTKYRGKRSQSLRARVERLSMPELFSEYLAFQRRFAGRAMTAPDLEDFCVLAHAMLGKTATGDLRVQLRQAIKYVKAELRRIRES